MQAVDIMHASPKLLEGVLDHKPLLDTGDDASDMYAPALAGSLPEHFGDSSARPEARPCLCDSRQRDSRWLPTDWGSNRRAPRAVLSACVAAAPECLSAWRSPALQFLVQLCQSVLC